MVAPAPVMPLSTRVQADTVHLPSQMMAVLPPRRAWGEALSYPFTHLHVHSTASDGTLTPAELVGEAKRLGYSALALTDHDTLAGHAAFLEAAAEVGMRPILGAELRVRSSVGVGHALVLADSAAGYARLTALLRRRPPYSIRELQGIGLVTSSCLGGEVARALSTHDYWLAAEIISEYQHALDDTYFLEIQPSFGQGLSSWIVSIGRTHGVPVLLTNDAHHRAPSDSPDAPLADCALVSEAQLRHHLSDHPYAVPLELAGYVADHYLTLPWRSTQSARQTQARTPRLGWPTTAASHFNQSEHVAGFTPTALTDAAGALS